MRSHLLSAVTALLLLATAACGGGAARNTDDADQQGGHLEASDVAMARPTGHPTYDGLATGTRRLGYDVLHAVAKHRAGNTVFSPASLALAFAMLREGAQGQTASEIDDVIGFPANRHRALNGLIRQLSHPAGGNTVEVNDALFLDPEFNVLRGYLGAIKQWYGAGVERVDFPTAAVAKINEWVTTHTHGRITKLVQHLDPQSELALINTIYLDAKWQSTFAATQTDDAPFTLTSGESVQVKMMEQEHHFDYAQTKAWQAVRLPYKGGKLSMWVLLPKGDAAAMSLLAPRVLKAAERRFASRSVALSLPRWKTRTTAQLKPILQSLGMAHVFDNADFSALASRPLHVSAVVQEATIEVGEKGTVASAATAVVGSTGAAPPPSDQVEFVADHPFAFVIMHQPTGVPLFEGVVSNPS